MATVPASAPAPPVGPIRSRANAGALNVAPWSSFANQTREHVPELRGQKRNATFERMRSTDAMVWSLADGTLGPIELYRWWIDPNGCDPGRVALLAEDFGLPVGEPDEDDDTAIERTSLPDEFDFGEMLHEVLLGVLFGHYFFEWSFMDPAETEGLYRLESMSPLHPATIRDIRSDDRGRLMFVQQDAGSTGTILGGAVLRESPKITAASLLPFVWMGDASCRWLGRSMLRPMYRNFLCKDVLMRVDLDNHSKAGGVPVVRTDNTFAGIGLEDLQRLASEFRVDQDAGAAMPPGAWIELLTAGTGDVVASMRWHDEQMAQVWHAMVRQLGTSATGSRALGSTLVDLEAMARRSIAEWARKTVNMWAFARWWMWNFGERNAPVLRFTAPEIESAPAPVAVAPAPLAVDPPAVAEPAPAE